MAFPDSTAVWLFMAAAVALLAVPGPAVLYIVFQSAEQGRRVGLASVAGVHLGTLIHVGAAAAGVSAILVASASAFAVVKFAGAAYLVYLGIRRLLRREADADASQVRPSLRSAFARGAVVNVLNPKTALFFLAFLPQFVAPERGPVWSQVLVLGSLFVALGLISDSLYALAAGRLGGAIRRHRTLLRHGSGIVFIGLGATAALAKRH